MYFIFRYFGSKFGAKDCVSVGLGFGMALTAFQFFKLKLPALVALKSIQEGSFVTGWVFLFINALYYTFWTLLFVSISILIYMGIRKRDRKEIIIAFILELVALLIPNMFNRVLGSFSLSLGKFLLLYLFYFGTIIVVAIICLVKGIRKKNIWIYLPYIALAIIYLAKPILAFSGVFGYFLGYSFISLSFIGVYNKYKNYEERMRIEREKTQPTL